MSRTIFFFVLAVLPRFVASQDFLHSGAFTSVFNLKNNNITGTTFLIDKDSINYFVTAKHILQNPQYGQKITVEILQDTLWKELIGTVFFDTTKNVDVVLIRPDGFSFVKSGISLKRISMILGDEGFFLGFPFNFSTTDKENINSGFPFPLIKKAVYSGSIIDDDILTLYLDGHNNIGFSGGPILFKDRFKNGDNNFHLVGIISGYIEHNRELTTPLGRFSYQENSGIIVGLGRVHIEEIIEGIKEP